MYWQLSRMNVKVEGGGSFHHDLLAHLFRNIEESSVQVPSFLDSLSSAMRITNNPRGVSFRLSEDGSKLHARVAVAHSSFGRGEKRTLGVSILGLGSLLRIRVQSESTNARALSVQNVRLPYRVSHESVQVVPNSDGTANVTMHVIGKHDDNSLLGTVGNRMTIGDDNDGDYCGNAGKTTIRYGVCACRQAAQSRRNVCYGNLILRVVKFAKQHKMLDLASQTRHIAMDCMHMKDSEVCLDRVAVKLAQVLEAHNAGEGSATTEEQVRQALAAEELNERGSASVGTVILRLLLFVLFVVAVGFFLRTWLLPDAHSSSFRSTSSNFWTVLNNYILGTALHDGRKLARRSSPRQDGAPGRCSVSKQL